TKNVLQQDRNWLTNVVFGRFEAFMYLPIKDWSIYADQVQLNLVDGGISYYPLADILFPLKSSTSNKYKDGKIVFQKIDGTENSILIDEALRKFEEKNLVQMSYILGSDRYGRDILSRLILGIRTSLLVGLIAIIISLIIGVSLGSLGGYFGGKVDQIVMLLINTSWSIPTLLLVFAIVLALGRGIGIIFIAVGLTMWVDVARIVRGEVKKLKEQNFILAAKVLGQKSSKIITSHILPNILGPVLVITAANFAIAILLEAGLSFLGFGVKPPAPSLGNLLNENYGYAISGKVWLALIPAISIMLLVLSFNLVGSGLRDAFDFKGRN
ncbi:MAG: ABC transporter permease, partial [Bacteroidia bacterium]|nr:ABC transporter permease [Bacteroidia bacterium]